MKIAKLEKFMSVMTLSALFLIGGAVVTNARGSDSQTTNELQQDKIRITGTVVERTG
jgi:hypothetical protein